MQARLRRVGVLVSAAAACALLVGQAAPMRPAVAATGAEECQVVNWTSGARSADLQEAINLAAPGDRLKVTGTCIGGFSIDQDLTLVGPARLDGTTCLSPTECYGGIVLWVDLAEVRLRNITIAHGSSTYDGGGVHNYGRLVLAGTTGVRSSLAEDGAGGIYNEGTLVMRDRSSVRGNSLLYGEGGGILNRGRFVMRHHSTVAGNTGVFGGGVYNAGTMIMRGWSTVTENTAEQGGGIYNTGTLALRDQASVTRNTATEGGGIFDLGTVTWTAYWSGTVCGNEPDDWPSCS